MAIRDILQAAAGASGPAIYVEDVFSTYLYAGNGTSQTINNGLALGPYSENGGSVSFNGTSTSYLSFTMPTSYFPGTGDFTLEFWLSSTDVNSLQGVIDFAFNNGGFGFYFQSGTLQFRIAGNDLVNSSFTSTTTPRHIAVVRSGSVLSMYVNGTRSSTTTNSTNIVPPSSITATISGFNGVGSYVLVSANISNVRYVKGTAVYNPSSSSLTVPTAKLTAVSGTQLLTCQLPNLTTDYSTNAISITKGANASTNLTAGGPTFYDYTVPYYGGLTWIKNRGAAQSHGLSDTARGAGNWMSSDLTVANIANNNGGVSAFTSTGFSVNTSDQQVNGSGNTYASWSFRKQPKFFDIVTYTGNGVGGRNINHNLGSAPGCIIIKCTSISSTNWMVWHRSISGQDNLRLNTTDGVSGVTDPISVTGFPGTLSTTQFTVDVGTGNDLCNVNGQTYVAYIFAHNAGGFGLTGNDNVISCGSYTGNGSTTGPEINLGYEPQWVMVKRTNSTGSWYILDTMRGFTVPQASRELAANTSAAESADYAGAFPMRPLSTGFQPYSADSGVNGSGSTYIYIAIRRGPMKTPTTGTSVFSPNTSSGGASTIIPTGFPNDLTIYNYLDGTGANSPAVDRLRGLSNSSSSTSNTLVTATAAAETGYNVGYDFWNTGFKIGTYFAGISNVFYSFRRAPGFFDIVCYTGTGTAQNVTHNLGVVPELMIIKRRNSATGGVTYSTLMSPDKIMQLFSNFGSNASLSEASIINTDPTSTTFNVRTDTSVNASGATYVAYLFASCPGVSKVGTYTGNGSSQTINCGFTAGARFILIKRTDSTGDWYVWDTARGIVANNDPHLSLNNGNAQVTTDDSVDADNSGFIVNQVSATNINVSSAKYLYLAIA